MRTDMLTGRRRPLVVIPVLGILAGLAAGCGSVDEGQASTSGLAQEEDQVADGDSDDASAPEDGTSHTALAPQRTDYPVTIEGCLGAEITFTEAPKRPMTLEQNAWELMMWLGLDDIQLAANVTDTAFLPEQFRESAQRNLDRNPVTPRIPDGQTFVQSTTVLDPANDPDMVLTLISTTLDSDSSTANLTEDLLAEEGITSYAGFSSGGCNGETDARTSLASVFDDIRNLGVIFDVQERASELIADMEESLAESSRKVADGGAERPQVLNVDYFLDPGFIGSFGANSSINGMIALAGGQNLFEDTPDLAGSGGFITTDFPTVLARRPDLVLIMTADLDEEDDPDCSAPIAVLQSELGDLEAVQQERFVCVSIHEAAFGGVRTVDVVEKLTDAIADLGDRTE